MNKNQRMIIIIGLALILLMGAIPPWEEYYDRGSEGTIVKLLHYSLIFVPPIPSYKTWSVRIDMQRLILQWIVVIIGSGLAYFMIFEKRSG